MSHITLRLLGGTGNQMFQIATAYAIAQQKNWDLHIDATGFSWYEFGSHKNLDLIKNIRLPYTEIVPKWHTYKQARGLKRPFMRLYASILKRRESIFTDGDNIHVYHANIQNIKPDTILKGYFQSYKYFDPIKSDMHHIFDLPISPPAQSVLSQIQQQTCPVAIHYRDYSDPNQGSQDIADTFGILDISYYKKSIEYIKNLYPNATFNVFSNRPESAKKLFTDYTIIDYNPDTYWDDMMVMTHCHHLIMGNSSYSWWAGYLNRHKNPIIITEKNWGNLLKNKHTSDIFLPDWVQI